MKNKIKLIILAFIIGLIPVIVHADGFSMGISCPSTAAAGSTVNCTLTMNPGLPIKGLQVKYNFSNGVTYKDFNVSNSFNVYSKNATGFVLGSGELSSSVTVGTLSITLPSNAESNSTYSIGLNDIASSDLEYNEVGAENVNSVIRIISDENRLSSLSISGASIPFNSDTLSYNVTINSPSSTISATPLDSHSKMSGNIGNVSLNYGVTTFNINVTSESGKTRTYTINVNRPDNRSKNNNLSSLSVNIGNINFNKNTTSYNLETKESNITISAKAEDSKSTISGIGTHSLSVGLNRFDVIVKAENGSEKIYTLNITRMEQSNTNNNLSSLIVTNTNLVFDKNVTTYNLVSNASTIYISAARESTTSTISGDIGKKNLKVGINKFVIKVTAQNGSVKKYTLNITRKQGKSNNNYLKSLTLSSGNISFKKTTTTYNVNVDKNVESITIKAELDDSKSSFENDFGPRDINLALGNNTIYLKVRSETGNVRTYILNINRDDGRDNDSSLKNIKLSSGKINFESNTLEYKVNVEYKINKIKIEAITNSEKAKVQIVGDENLSVGDNVFKIIVEAENGKKTEYKLTVIRKENGYTLSSNNKIESLIIKNHSIDFKSNVYKYTLKTKENKLNIAVNLEDEKATYKIIGNNNLKNKSSIKIKVTAENGDQRVYQINIKKTNIIFVIILLLFVVSIIGIIIYLFTKYMKQKNTHYEIIDLDKIQEENNNENIEPNDDNSDFNHA